jgi:hypothetical protein
MITAAAEVRDGEAEWKPIRNALDKSDRKKFDEMIMLVPLSYHPSIEGVKKP